MQDGVVPPAGGMGANVAAAAGGALKFVGGTPPGWAMPAGAAAAGAMMGAPVGGRLVSKMHVWWRRVW